MEPGGSTTLFKPSEVTSQVIHQSLDDVPKGGRAQDESVSHPHKALVFNTDVHILQIWQGFNPHFGFIVEPGVSSTTPNFHTTTFLGTLNNRDIGNHVSSLTLGHSQQYSHHFLGENSIVEYAYLGEAPGNFSTHFTTLREIPNLSDRHNVRYLLLCESSVER